jgi:hypothetical protein
MRIIDLDKVIPEIFNRDDKLIAFREKMDSIMTDLENDTLGLNDIIDPFKCPPNILSYLGDYLSAGIVENDSEAVKRNKIATAVASHKKRGSFVFDVKPKIDIIAGGDSAIYTGVGGDDWIIPGDGMTPTDFYWSALGADGIDDDLGISLIGAGDEVEIAGVIWIDCDNNFLEWEDLESIKLSIEDSIPAYYIVVLGSIVDGIFKPYPTDRYEFLGTSDGQYLVTSTGEPFIVGE